MALWRDHDAESWAATILVAAESMGVQPVVVEKDYWVCEALRGVVAAHPGEVVFKGGTSLEKLRIIRRFSEDLDLLVVGEYPSKNAAKGALRKMVAAAAAATGGHSQDEISGGNPGSFHRSARLELPLEHVGGGLAEPKAILVELGQSGGPKPSAPQMVDSLLCRAMRDTEFYGQWDDLAPFEVTILHPGRTLIEKLLRVNNFAADPARRSTPHGLPRIGRQFYDVWALLGHPPVIELLSDREQFTAILQSIFEVSEAFTPDLPVPEGGFAASDAFDPASALASDLADEHERAMDSFFYGDEPPTFDDVLRRIQECAELLDPQR